MIGNISWEAIVGICTLATTFTAVLKLILRINRTLTTLEETVRCLQLYLRDYMLRIEQIGRKLEQHEIRLVKLESDKEE